MPAEAGIQEFGYLQDHWIPAFAAVTTYCWFIKNRQLAPFWENR